MRLANLSTKARATMDAGGSRRGSAAHQRDFGAAPGFSREHEGSLLRHASCERWQRANELVWVEFVVCILPLVLGARSRRRSLPVPIMLAGC